MPILRFATNIPQQVHLRSLEGKPVESQFGGFQHMFSAEEGAFYVSDKVGGILMEQFKKLGVNVGDPIEICKSETGNGTGRKTQWVVSWNPEKTSNAAEPPSELEQQLAESIKQAEAKKAAQRAPQAVPVEQP